MKFGAMVATSIADWQLLKFAEDLGYDHGWVPDSQMIWSDCYAVLALAAEHTSRIRLGTGVAVAPTRSAPVTAHSIATINRIAPGRVFLGIGTGHTAMRTMGFDPIRARAFRNYLRVVRALLRGEEVEYTVEGRTRSIRFLHRELGFVDVEHEIPIWVAANGPLALRAAGAYGDGRISAGLEAPDHLRTSLDAIRAGAKATGRDGSLGDDFHTAALCYSCVLRPGESLSDDRVIDACGSMAMAGLHFWWELAEESGDDAFVPDSVRPDWERYLAFVRGLGIPGERIHLRLHEGHCTYLVPEERRFVTPEVIRASGGLVGTPEEIVETLEHQEGAGLKEVTLLPPMAFARELLAEFSEHVMSRM
jgi:alkanesulfonate monooxygenase SsuD/methylene tetrahydromethanopterin reductase-like flavin-dependent oxidoreductase (luciferase family)